MKYEIINPSDKCFITSDDERLAEIVCVMLGNGSYGLKDENGNTVLCVLEPLDISEEEVLYIFKEKREELAKVFLSFEYADKRTSLNNIQEKSFRLGDNLKER